MTIDARAARLHEHGAPLVVEDVRLAEPQAGEVVVDMAFAGVNPVDRYMALGRVAPDAERPRTLGSEGAGTVGGRPVVVRGRVWATKVVAPQSSLIQVPEGVDLATAAAMGVAGVTAWRCVTEIAEVRDDDRALVLGASGGVGSMIVSVVRSLGATVWGQCATDAKRDFVKACGAEEVVVGDAAAISEAIAKFRPSVVFDPLGGAFTGAAVGAMEPRGRLVLFGTSADSSGVVPLQQFYRKSLRMLGYGGLMETEEAIAAGIRAALAAVVTGRLEVVIDSVLPLDRVNDALARLLDRSVSGKLVLDLRS